MGGALHAMNTYVRIRAPVQSGCTHAGPSALQPTTSIRPSVHLSLSNSIEALHFAHSRGGHVKPDYRGNTENKEKEKMDLNGSKMDITTELRFSHDPRPRPRAQTHEPQVCAVPVFGFDRRLAGP